MVDPYGNPIHPLRPTTVDSSTVHEYATVQDAFRVLSNSTGWVLTPQGPTEMPVAAATLLDTVLGHTFVFENMHRGM